MRFHGLENSLTCLEAEVNGDIPALRGDGKMSEVARAVKEAGDGNPLFE